MNQNASPSVFKIAAIFTITEFVFRFLSTIVMAKFDLTFFFNWDFLIYSIGTEALFVFVSAGISTSVSTNLPDFSLTTILLRVFSYAFSYILLVALVRFIIMSNFELFTSFLFHLPHAVKISFMFIVVWMILKYYPNEKRKKSNPELVDN